MNTTDDDDLSQESAPVGQAEVESSVPAEGDTTGGDEASEGEESYRLTQQVDIRDVGPCKKHVRVQVPRADIEHFYDKAVGELVTSAAVPGFRPGRVPRKLVEKRFRREVSDSVKQRLLMESLEQLADEYELDAINEPNFDAAALVIPEQGDFTYEFDVEVRPVFDLPNYSGLSIRRPTRELTDADVERYLARYLEQHGQLAPVDGPARADDFIVTNITVRNGDVELARYAGKQIRVRPVLKFRDAEVANFGEMIVGASVGDSREAEIPVSVEADVPDLRGEKVLVRFDITDVQRLQLPELTSDFLAGLGHASAEDLRTEVRKLLDRQLLYEQRQVARQQVLGKITESATWELPESLVRRQVENALRRELIEMQQAGFTDAEIRARQSELQQRQLSMTRQALKEHFVLDKIATEEKLEVTPTDIDYEVMMMSIQRGESPRKMRARLERQGLMDNLVAQILERKAIDVVLSRAKYEDVPAEQHDPGRVEGLDVSICGTSTAPTTTIEAEAEAKSASPAS